MERQQALEEVRFIKNLLEDTGKEIGKSGWAFIWLGLIFMAQYLIFLCLPVISNLGVFQHLPSWVNTTIFLTISIGVLTTVIFLSILFYRKQISQQGAVALEKQIWQIWLWMIVGSIAIQLGSGITYLLVFFQNKAGSIIYMEDYSYSLLITLPLIITGVLTKRRFFYGAAIFTLISCLVVDFSFSGVKHHLEKQICDAFINGFPFLITGIYFRYATRKHGIKTS